MQALQRHGVRMATMTLVNRFAFQALGPADYIYDPEVTPHGPSISGHAVLLTAIQHGDNGPDDTSITLSNFWGSDWGLRASF